MKEIFEFLKELIKSKFLFILVLGVVLILLGLAHGVTYKGLFLIEKPWNFFVAAGGLVFVILGTLGLYFGEPANQSAALEPGEPANQSAAVEPEWTKRLYTFHGLSEELQVGSRDEECFQNFNIDRDAARNLNGVYFLWADTQMGCRINAWIERDETGDFFLRVSFVNCPDSYVSNLAIHPQDRKAFKNEPFKRYLRFMARVPAGVKSEGATTLEKVGLHVRLVNGHVQHWQHASSPQEWCKNPVSGSDWKEITVDLDQKDQWVRFNSDGNHLYGPDRPDFSIISSIVFDFGKFTRTGTLGEGAGVVDLKRIRLVK